MFTGNWGKMNPNQQDAIRSLYYNLGTNADTGTLKKAINGGRLQDVPGILPLYKMSGGKVNPGLVNRRNEEILLYNTPWTPTLPTQSGAPNGR